MAIRRILVPLFGADQPGPDHPDRPALHTALMVARLFGAHVDALYRLFRLDSDDHLRRLPPAYLEGYYRQLEAASRAHGAQRDAAAQLLEGPRTFHGGGHVVGDGAGVDERAFGLDAIAQRDRRSRGRSRQAKQQQAIPQSVHGL